MAVSAGEIPMRDQVEDPNKTDDAWRVIPVIPVMAEHDGTQPGHDSQSAGGTFPRDIHIHIRHIHMAYCTLCSPLATAVATVSGPASSAEIWTPLCVQH